MKKVNLFSKLKNKDLVDLDELFDDNWRYKAERLQIRRWRKIKHGLA